MKKYLPLESAFFNNPREASVDASRSVAAVGGTEVPSADLTRLKSRAAADVVEPVVDQSSVVPTRILQVTPSPCLYAVFSEIFSFLPALVYYLKRVLLFVNEPDPRREPRTRLIPALIARSTFNGDGHCGWPIKIRGSASRKKISLCE